MSLTRRQRARLEEAIQYLNLEEMQRFCRAHGLPRTIQVEGPDGRLRRTGDRDRKDVVLARILDFALRGKTAGPTVYARSVVSDRPLPSRLTRRVRVHYGQYEKKNEAYVAIMKKLTGGAYRNGMIARLVLRDFWTAGVAPTLAEFAEEWMRATEAHTRPRPEGAYLVDRWKGTAGPDWKERRTQRAREALQLLEEALAEREP